MSDQNVFSSKQFQISSLIDQVHQGDIALPDLQRPFVWKQYQIRDLLDSLYSGYPVGFILLWEIGNNTQQSKGIGEETKARDPRFLVIDGQQRLTALYVTLLGKEVKDKNFQNVRPRIGFHPLEERFEVTNKKIDSDPFWISDVSDLFQEVSMYSFLNTYLSQLHQHTEITQEEENHISQSIERLIQVKNYPFTVLELSSELDPEQISEIFVRVNSKGKELNQSDFVLTVLSVYLPEIREKIEQFSADSKKIPEGDKPVSYNTVLEVDAGELVRPIFAEAFNRGQLRYAPPLLRGRDLEKLEQTPETRDKHLNLFSEATSRALDLTVWHGFIGILKKMGVINPSLISSRIAVFYTYGLYLYARRIGLDMYQQEEFVMSWLFMSWLTTRYISSGEATFQQDLQDLKRESTPETFIRHYKNIVSRQLSDDFWNIELPTDKLVTTSTQQPAYLVYLILLNRKNAKILFSETRLRDVLGNEEIYKKQPLDRHHLFPVNYLTDKEGITDRRDINQIANLCYIEYPVNIKISDKAPSEYFPQLMEKTGVTEEQLHFHAIPEEFWKMDYQEFLDKRRELMAQVIREGVEEVVFAKDK